MRAGTSFAALAGCLVLGSVLGCGGEADPCELAEEHVSSCSPGTTIKGCSAETADQILSTPCEAFTRATQSTSGRGGWTCSSYNANCDDCVWFAGTLGGALGAPFGGVPAVVGMGAGYAAGYWVCPKFFPDSDSERDTLY